MLGKRLLYGAATFFVLFIVQFVIVLINGDTEWSLFWDGTVSGKIMECPETMHPGAGQAVTITTKEPIQISNIQISQNFIINVTGNTIIVTKINDIYTETLLVAVTTDAGIKDSCVIEVMDD